RSRHLKLYPDAERDGAARLARWWRDDGTLHGSHAVLLTAAAHHGELRVRADPDGRREEAGVEVHRPDGRGGAVRDVLRGHVPVPGAHRRIDAVDFPADGYEAGSHGHALAVVVRMDWYPRHDVVPVRPVRNTAYARL